MVVNPSIGARPCVDGSLDEGLVADAEGTVVQVDREVVDGYAVVELHFPVMGVRVVDLFIRFVVQSDGIRVDVEWRVIIGSHQGVVENDFGLGGGDEVEETAGACCNGVGKAILSLPVFDLGDEVPVATEDDVLRFRNQVERSGSVDGSTVVVGRGVEIIEERTVDDRVES